MSNTGKTKEKLLCRCSQLWTGHHFFLFPKINDSKFRSVWRQVLIRLTISFCMSLFSDAHTHFPIFLFLLEAHFSHYFKVKVSNWGWYSSKQTVRFAVYYVVDLFKGLYLLVFVYLYMIVCVYVCACKCSVCRVQRKRSDPLGWSYSQLWAIWLCAGNQTQAVCRNSEHSEPLSHQSF